ncbi:hypothetical protein [Facklamia miroungae]|nr:hypothetical protein [Facklamia miroungae]
MLSNLERPFIYKIFDDYKEIIMVINANRMINANAKKRGAINEVIIKN